MKQALLLFLLLILNGVIYCQSTQFQAPDYNKIEKTILEKESNLFYDSLMSRYIKGDTSMTLDEKRHLYYGYSFHKNYSPYGKINYVDSLNKLFDVKEKADLNLPKIIAYSDSALRVNPFEVNVLDGLVFAYQLLENESMANNIRNRITTIIDAIFSSGDGVIKKSAFYVLYIQHEYFMINVIGFVYGGSQTQTEVYDYLTLAENEYDLEGFYFEISPLFNNLINLTRKKR